MRLSIVTACLLLTSGCANAAVSLVQQVNVAGSSGTTITVTVAAPSVGDFLAVVVGGIPTTPQISGITGGGVTWMKSISGNVNRNTEIWAGAGSTGVGTSIVITFAGSLGGANDVYFMEFSGGVTITSDGAAANSDATNVFVPTATLVTTHAVDVIIAGYRANGNTSSGPTNGFTGLTSSVLNAGAAYLVTSATGSYSTVWGAAGVITDDAVIAAFKVTTPPSGGSQSFIF